MIITPDIFEGEITLGQVESLSVKSSINWFINKYEPELLNKVLGKKLATELTEGLEADPIEDKWIALRDIMKPIIANYVYTMYQRNNTTSTTGSGEVKSKAETADRISPLSKIVRARNEMVDLIRELSCDMQNYPFNEDYPEYCPGENFKKMNVFGI